MAAQSPQLLDALFPDLAAQDQAVQRKLMLSQMLMQQGQQQQPDNQMAGAYVVPNSPLAGLNRMLSTGLGALTMRKAQDQQLDIAKQRMGQMAALVNGTAPEATAGSGQGMSPQAALAAGAAAGQPGPRQATAALMDNPQIAPGNAPQPDTSAPAPQGQAAPVVPQGGFGPPGMPGNQRIMGMLLDPGKYLEATMKQYEQTPEMKNLAAAYGLNSPQYQAAMRQVAANLTAPKTEGVRPGNSVYQNGKLVGFAPDFEKGIFGTLGPNGQPIAQQIPGAQGIMAGNAGAVAGAQEAARAAYDPQTTYDANGRALPPVSRLDLLRPRGAAPGPVAGQPGVSTGGQAVPPTAPQTGTLVPPLGASAGADANVKDNIARFGAIRTAAADAPTRVNVLDQIIGLSQEGVLTGPGQDFFNKMKGVAATAGQNIPGLGEISAKWRDDVTGAQEMSKFLQQNGIRAWQAAGGSGTDAQLEAALKANPNDKMYPQAVQDVARWAKAGEYALQAKHQAMSNFIGPNMENAPRLHQFEAEWNKNFDPRIFQMKMVENDPAALGKIMRGMPQGERGKLLEKYNAMKAKGWLQ